MINRYVRSNCQTTHQKILHGEIRCSLKFQNQLFRKLDPRRRYIGKINVLPSGIGFVKTAEMMEMFGRDIFITPR